MRRHVEKLRRDMTPTERIADIAKRARARKHARRIGTAVDPGGDWARRSDG